MWKVLGVVVLVVAACGGDDEPTAEPGGCVDADAGVAPFAAGPTTQELEVTLPAAEYAYVCDIHPNMVGRLDVTSANPVIP